MRYDIKNNELSSCRNNKQPQKIKIEKVSKDYCIINGNKIEGNACSTILNDK